MFNLKRSGKLNFDLNLTDVSFFGEYKEAIKNGFIDCGKYSELVKVK